PCVSSLPNVMRDEVWPHCHKGSRPLGTKGWPRGAAPVRADHCGRWLKISIWGAEPYCQGARIASGFQFCGATENALDKARAGYPMPLRLHEYLPSMRAVAR